MKSLLHKEIELLLIGIEIYRLLLSARHFEHQESDYGLYSVAVCSLNFILPESN